MEKETYYELDYVVEIENMIFSTKENCEDLDEVKEMLDLAKGNNKVLNYLVTKCDVTREIVEL